MTTRWEIVVLCPHQQPRDQKLVTFLYENVCPSWCVTDHANDNHEAHRGALDRDGRGYFEPAPDLEHAWISSRGLTANNARTMRETDLHLGPLIDQARRVDAPREPYTLTVRPDGSVDDSDFGEWSDGHLKHRLHCSVCGDDLQIRHARIVPVLDGLRRSEVPEVTLAGLRRLLH
jgi:hypothetical protein